MDERTKKYFANKPKSDDQVNQAILTKRAKKILSFDHPIVGDWVIFKDRECRISHVWEDRKSKKDFSSWGFQTSDHGSFYLGSNGCSFSGSLRSSTEGKLLSLTGEIRPGRIWIFNRGEAGAHRGKYFEIPFKVWRADIEAPF